MIVVVRDEDLVGARVQGHAKQFATQTAHTNHRRRVQHTQDGAVHGQYLHAMLVSDHQGPSCRHRPGPGVGELPRLRALRAQVLPHGAVAQAPQGLPMIKAISNHNNGALLQGIMSENVRKVEKKRLHN